LQEDTVWVGGKGRPNFHKVAIKGALHLSAVPRQMVELHGPLWRVLFRNDPTKLLVTVFDKLDEGTGNRFGFDYQAGQW